MINRRSHMIVRVGSAALMAGLLALSAGGGHHVQAAGADRVAQTTRTHHLQIKDFYDVQEVDNVTGSKRATVAGVTYPRGFELVRGFAHLSYNVHRYAGYKSLTFLVGMTDSSDAGSQNTLVLTADGRILKTIKAQPGEPAVKVVVPCLKTSVPLPASRKAWSEPSWAVT